MVYVILILLGIILISGFINYIQNKKIKSLKEDISHLTNVIGTYKENIKKHEALLVKLKDLKKKKEEKHNEIENVDDLDDLASMLNGM
jgi:predicted RNase H-like nuclease (RuvC/YqgF family)